MNEKISLILAQMAELEASLRTAVHEQESRISFQNNRFLAYGDAEAYEVKLQEYRIALGSKK